MHCESRLRQIAFKIESRGLDELVVLGIVLHQRRVGAEIGAAHPLQVDVHETVGARQEARCLRRRVLPQVNHRRERGQKDQQSEQNWEASPKAHRGMGKNDSRWGDGVGLQFCNWAIGKFGNLNWAFRHMSQRLQSAKLLAYGALVGMTYGLSMRLLARLFPPNELFSVMSISFVLVLPFCMGFLSVFLVERRQEETPWFWLALSVLPVTGALLGTIVTALEGWICVVMFAPIGLICSILGGLAGGVAARYSKNMSITCIVFLPLLINPWEAKVFLKNETRTVRTSIDIRATPSIVWRNVETVPRISVGELSPSWTRKLGFPRPLEATLSHQGLGGIRHARFEGGVLFIETVDAWEPEHDLAFSIKAETSKIPATTLDSHVTVGGPFFDTLRGEYTLEPLSGGVTRLHLLSQHRLSTNFNWYAHLWTDAVMADIQNSILMVIKARCENQR